VEEIVDPNLCTTPIGHHKLVGVVAAVTRTRWRCDVGHLEVSDADRHGLIGRRCAHQCVEGQLDGRGGRRLFVDHQLIDAVELGLAVVDGEVPSQADVVADGGQVDALLSVAEVDVEPGVFRARVMVCIGGNL